MRANKAVGQKSKCTCQITVIRILNTQTYLICSLILSQMRPLSVITLFISGEYVYTYFYAFINTLIYYVYNKPVMESNF